MYYDDDDCFEREQTYERYNGSYAQDVEGWSDQDIDDVFDGDPEAYWNIDWDNSGTSCVPHNAEKNLQSTSGEWFRISKLT